ncbi:MAG: hypothetical protein ACK40V_07760 [Anaerolineales bacterium]
MPNKNYVRGRRLEYDLVKELISINGCDFAQRMAGSHSPYDVIGVNKKSKTAYLVQCKTKLKDISGHEDSEIDTSHGWSVVAFKRTKFIKRRIK